MAGPYAQTAWGSGDVQGAAINASDAGDNTLVAGVADRRIVVLSYSLVASQAVTATFESEDGTVIGGPCAFSGNGGISVPECSHGLFAAKTGEALVLDLNGAVQVGGHLVYAVCR
jgi:hypothetical protein